MDLTATAPAALRVTGRGALRIFAAGSLRPAFAQLAAEVEPGALAFQYANARDLAERIVGGEPVDVFASASAEHPLELHRARLAGAPRAFATNALVVAVPDASPARDFRVLAMPGTRVVIEVAGIPCGDYTRELLQRLDALEGHGFAERVFANVITQEQTVDHVAALLLDGTADAAILYATDVAARPGRLRAVALPDSVAVKVTCVACVVGGSRRPDAAATWVDYLMSAPAQAILRRAGFGSPV